MTTDQDDPIERLRAALARARGSEPLEGTVCVLATADAAGRPSARCVLLKDVDAQGLTFYTNYGSRKARDIEQNPSVALCFHWPSLEEQVRVEGRVERVDAATSEAYFQSRPRESQLGAWASRQSTPVASRQALDEAFAEVERRFDGAPVPRPETWGGYRLVPSWIEFWISRPHRMHDRLAYTRTGDGWTVQRLYP
jgi:pyridoxamine 5'-phosphate oxidase